MKPLFPSGDRVPADPVRSVDAPAVPRRGTLRALAGLAAVGSAPSAFAQSGEVWPARPVRVIVPAGAGSGTDLFARFVCERLGQALGQPMVLENKPGASGAIGTDIVAKAKPDGYTLLFSNASFTAMLQGLAPKLPYDLMRDLAPIAQIGVGGVFLVVAPDFPARTLQEFVEQVRAEPGKWTYGTWGVGSSAHLTMEALKRNAGLKIDHVAYKALPQILQDIQAGVLKVGWLDITSSQPHIKAGRVRALAVSGTARTPNLPEIPTMTEAGFRFEVDGWYAMFAPAGTPAGIVERLNVEVNRVLQSPEGRERLATMNVAQAPQKTPAQFADTLRSDVATWSRIVQENGIRID
jgi:tripartite-type tricarboxylate transporter receptor subunit TctC